MDIESERFRETTHFPLALISMGLSGLVLLVFGSVAWWSLSRSQLRSLDRDLKTFGYRFASRSGPNVDGKRQEETMIGIFGTEEAPYRFFAFLAQERVPLFRTGGWPESLDPATFSPGREPLDPQPEVILPPPKEKGARPAREARTILEPRFYTVKSREGRYRLGVFSNRDVILVCGGDLDRFSRDVNQLRNAYLVALPGALLMIALGAWWLGKKALRPVEALGEDMEHVSAQALDQRLEAGKADAEFARIIRIYNAMLERLERSFEQANRFSADASHELKTPLAIMRGTLERALAHCEDDSDALEVFSDLLEQTGRQGAILESLLLLSRADAGRLEISRDRFDLSRTLETWLEDASLLAESRDIGISSEIEPGIEVEGDPVMLQRMAHNLFSNAVRYNHDGGRIECRLSRSSEGVRWTVANTGEGIPESDREKVFDRFVRGRSLDEDRDGGSGLGLSLAREIVLAHGGDIRVVGSGLDLTIFEVTLPVVDPPDG